MEDTWPTPVDTQVDTQVDTPVDNTPVETTEGVMGCTKAVTAVMVDLPAVRSGVEVDMEVMVEEASVVTLLHLLDLSHPPEATMVGTPLSPEAEEGEYIPGEDTPVLPIRGREVLPLPPTEKASRVDRVPFGREEERRAPSRACSRG